MSAFYDSLKNQQLHGQGISRFSMVVTLEKSDNPYLAYPVKGVLTVIEQGTNLSLNKCIFNIFREDGGLGCPVEIGNPSFVVNNTIRVS